MVAIAVACGAALMTASPWVMNPLHESSHAAPYDRMATPNTNKRTVMRTPRPPPVNTLSRRFRIMLDGHAYRRHPPHRALRESDAPRSGRDGRGVSRPRSRIGAAGRGEGDARLDARLRGAVPPRGAVDRAAHAREHRAGVRLRRRR